MSEINHSDRAHALLSASAAERWLNCPAAPRLEETLPERTSEYAEEGRLAHEIAELRLRKQYTTPMSTRTYNAALKKLQQSPHYDAEMLTHVEAYYDFIAGIVHSYTAKPFVGLEIRVDYSHIAPEGFGTSDCIIIGGETMHVIDFKYGKGVAVDAEANSQMMLYALGALSLFAPFYAIKRVVLAVAQPRLDTFSPWAITVEDLTAWGEDIKPKAHLAYRGGGPCVPGDWCRWCRAGAVCRTRAEKVLEIEGFKALDPLLLNPTQLGDVLTRGKAMGAWLSAVETHALATVLRGDEIPGWKAVNGRSSRVFTDMDKAFLTIVANGTDEAMLYKREPLTLAATEKLLGKKQFDTIVGEYVKVQPGKPTLVPVSDRREPYRNTGAEEDFQPIPSEA